MLHTYVLYVCMYVCMYVCTYVIFCTPFISQYTYGISHMQRRTCWWAPASTHLKWVSHRTTLLAHVLTRACVLLSFMRALACRVLKNLLKHHKSFTIAILCERHATINLVDMIRNHSGLLQESWPDSSSNSYLPNMDCDESLWAGTKIYRNKWVIPDPRITLDSLVEYTSFLIAINVIQNCGRPLAFLWSLTLDW